MNKVLIIMSLLVLFNSKAKSNVRLVQNIKAVTNAIGIIKYFHPTKNATAINWDKFTQFAVFKVKNLESDNQLCDTLNFIFRDIAADVRFSPIIDTSDTEKKTIYKADESIYFWKHKGYGYGKKEYSLFMKLFFSNWNSKVLSCKVKDCKFKYLLQPHSFQLNDSISCNLVLASNSQIFNNKIKSSINFNLDFSTQFIQYSSFINAWNILKHFYPNATESGFDFDNFLEFMVLKIDQGLSNEKFELYMRNYLLNLNDKHIGFGNREKRNVYFYKYKHFRLPFELKLIENKVIVSQINDSITPFHIGDVILSVNNQNLDSLLKNEISFHNEKNRAIRQKNYIEKMLFAYNNEQVEFIVKKKNSTIKLNIRIKLIEDHRPHIQEFEENYFYINFSYVTEKELKQYYEKLKNASGIIADSRERTAGAMNFFIKQITCKPIYKGTWFEPLFYFPYQKYSIRNKVNQILLKPDKNLIKVPIVFLAGPNCYSAGESNLETIKYYKLGVIIGEPTAGCNGDVNLAYLNEKYVLSFTQLKVLNRDGSDFSNIGILPDIYFPDNFVTISNDNDPIINFALQHLKNK